MQKHSGKPLVKVPAGGEDFLLALKVPQETSIPVYKMLEKVMEALKALRKYYHVTAKALRAESFSCVD